MSEGGSLPTTLQQVTLQTVAYNASTCMSEITDWHVQLCAGVSGGGKGYSHLFPYISLYNLLSLLFLDTCQGDSGGPLMMFSSNNQWVLVGATSNGIGCAEAAYSGVYTRIAAFEGWINSTMSSASRHTKSNTRLLFLFCTIFVRYIL